MRLRIRSSALLFQLATGACEQASRGDGSQAIVEIVLAVMTLETFINELAELPAYPPEFEDGRVAQFADIMREVEKSRGSLETRYRFAKWIFAGRAYDMGQTPYQDFALLLSLRNALVHLKPMDWEIDETSFGLTVNHPSVVERLKSKRLIVDTDSKEKGRTWLQVVSTKEVAKWACNRVVAMIRGAIDDLPSNPNRDRQKRWMKDDFQPIP